MKKINIYIGIIMVLLGISSNLNAQNDMLNMKQESLDRRSQKIVTISAFAAKGELDKLQVELNARLDAGLTVNEIKEVLVHIYAYSGFPRSLRGLKTLMAVVDQRKAEGVKDVWGREASLITDTRDKYQRGKEILAELSGVAPSEGRVTTRYAGFSPEIETFLKEHLFADIFERDVLTYSQREMVTVSVIAALGELEPMLTSHIGLALNLGISPAQLEQLIRLVEVNVGKKEGDVALNVLNGVLASKGLTTGSTDALAKQNTASHIFPIGEKINNDYFSGTAWLQWLMTDKDNFDVTVGNVIFEPGVRNNWHSHPGGQILISTRGTGYYQEKGKPIQLLRVGDVIEIQPDIVHWHGATPDSEFEHIAIGTKTHKGGAVWLGAVTDEEYNGFKQ